MNSSDQSNSAAMASPNKAYQWLLVGSLCLTALLCWLYVTKPVQVIHSAPTLAIKTPEASSLADHQKTPQPPASQLIPSDNALPGVDVKGGEVKSTGGVPRPVDPRKIVSSGDGSGWETTNARVQHILRADTGTGELSKIVLNVPVLYQTRTMRWTPTDIQKARDVLTRLMVYENNLSKVKMEGKALLSDWNQLLEKTVPSESLRADSPSLPYNHGYQTPKPNLPDSGSSIKVE